MTARLSNDVDVYELRRVGVTVSEQTTTPDADQRRAASPQEWNHYSATIDKLCKIKDSETVCRVIFLKTPTSDDEGIAVRDRLSQTYGIPARYWSKLCQDANGYFSTSRPKPSNKDDAAAVRTELRLLSKKNIKDPDQEPNSKAGIDYVWDLLGFFTAWTPQTGTQLLCFDSPMRVRKLIVESIKSYELEDLTGWPFAIHEALFKALVPHYDEAVWQWRDRVRAIEQKRPKIEAPNSNYVQMHELQRHITHSTENLATALNVIEQIIQASSRYEAAGITQTQWLSENVHNEMRCYKSALQFLHLRSQALESRLTNEINLVLHINTQHDSLVAQHIAEMSGQEGRVMKTITIAGLLFLPGTFMSAIFSMSFFNFTPASEDNPAKWSVSDRFWIYWVITIPLTVLTFLYFTQWQRSLHKKPSFREQLERTHRESQGQVQPQTTWPQIWTHKIKQQKTILLDEVERASQQSYHKT